MEDSADARIGDLRCGPARRRLRGCRPTRRACRSPRLDPANVYHLCMRLLVVEDETDLADAVARGLRREGYAVDVAYDGDDALAKTGVNAYDLVGLDLNLPGAAGVEV